MKNPQFRKYYILSLLGVLLASAYPIWMGASVVADMITYGTVYAENYPKYIIPYTPIALAVLIGVALLPVVMKQVEKCAFAAGSAVSVGVFFVAEWMLESMVTVTRTVTVTGVDFSKLEAWQMSLCAVTPEVFQSGTITEVDMLMGEYSPAFKLHFYIISVVLILSVLNCFYGFGKMILTGDNSRQKSLVLQSVASAAFLGMCIWACFTAFYRTGTIRVSALSAVLMAVFFVLFGVTVGIYVASFTMHRRKLLSVGLPALMAVVTTLVMYIGEMILLSGNLYRFGTGFLFNGIAGIVLAPVDILIIGLSGGATALIANWVRKK